MTLPILFSFTLLTCEFYYSLLCFVNMFHILSTARMPLIVSTSTVVLKGLSRNFVCPQYSYLLSSSCYVSARAYGFFFSGVVYFSRLRHLDILFDFLFVSLLIFLALLFSACLIPDILCSWLVERSWCVCLMYILWVPRTYQCFCFVNRDFHILFWIMAVVRSPSKFL